MKLNEKRMINDIRLLSLDMINEASGGYPGCCLGFAPSIYTLLTYHLKFDLERRGWCNRDRLIVSPNMGALLYASLFYCLDDFSMDDLKNYRRLASCTPFAPSYDLNHRIECSSYLNGDNLSIGVGMAIAEKYLASTFNRRKNTIFDYNIYTVCTESDIMEGSFYEAASLAGNLGLDNLIVLYDANGVTPDGNLDREFTESITDRFSSMEWNVFNVKNGDSVSEISSAIEKAKKSNRPSLIQINTTIGKYSRYEGTNRVYQGELEEEDLKEIREGLKGSDRFSYDKEVRDTLLEFIKDGTEDYYKEWYQEYEMYMANSTDSEKDSINMIIENEGISLDLAAVIDASKIFEDKPMRDINYQVMNVISTFLPNFMGGSSDALSMTKTYLKGGEDFSIDNYAGRNICFGSRESAMSGVVTGLALSGIRPFASTLLINADKMKSGIRQAAMMRMPVTYIFTHDSILSSSEGASEAVEQLGMLRSIPNVSLYRPCDYKELIGSWTNILKSGDTSILVLPKGHAETMKYTSPSKVSRGGYIISEVKTRLDLILIASGSEVSLALKIKEELLRNYIEARVVSMPNMNLFLKQDKDYQEQVLPTGYRRMVIEFSNDPNWYRFITSEDDFIGVNKYSKGGSNIEVLSYFELDMQDIIIKIKNNL